MTTPTYVATKTGDQYDLEPQQSEAAEAALPPASWTPWIGGGLIVLGLARRGLAGAVLCAAGGAVLCHALGQVEQAEEQLPAAYNPMPPLETTASPTYPNEADRPNEASRTGQLPEDQVDEESMESFPASDAPSSSVSRSS